MSSYFEEQKEWNCDLFEAVYKDDRVGALTALDRGANIDALNCLKETVFDYAEANNLDILDHLSNWKAQLEELKAKLK